MDDPILTIEEREAINSGRWFSSLSPSLRHDILRCAYVKRYKDGELIAARQSIEQTREFLGADSLGYLSMQGMLEAVGDAEDTRFCKACYTGQYPTLLGRHVETSRQREVMTAVPS